MQKIVGVFNKVSPVVFSFLSIYAVNLYFFNDSINYKNSVINLFLFFILIRFIKSVAAAISNRYATGAALGAAFVFSLVMVLGEATNRRNDLTLIYDNPVSSLIMFGGFFVLFYYVLKQLYINLNSLHVFAQYGMEKSRLLFNGSVKSFFLCWLIIFAAWLPSFFAYYPGIYSYDAGTQTFHIVYNDINNFHPVLHTLFWKACIYLGNRINGTTAAGLSVYALTQMFILSAIFAYAVTCLSRLRVHAAFRIIALVYFAFFPVNAVFSFVMTKDVFWTGLFILFTLMSVDMARRSEVFFQSVSKILWLSVIILLICMFRNNGMHTILLLTPCILIILRKHYIKILLVFLTPVLLYQFVIKGLVFPMFNIGLGDPKEMFSAPIQQIARVVVEREPQLSDSDKRDIAKFLNYKYIKQNFNPRFADPVKDDFNTDYYKQNPAEFFSLWYDIGKKYPLDYLHEQLALTLGYWYPDIQYPDPYSHRAYIETWLWDVQEFKVKRRSKLPKLLGFYESIVAEVIPQRVPVLSVIFSVGFPFWVIVTSLSICIAKRRWKLMLMFLPGLMYWATYQGCSTAAFRYMYPVIASYPIYLAAIVQPHLFSVRGRLKFNPKGNE